MALRDTFLNMLGVSSNENQKTNNSALRSARDFMKYGSRDRIYPTWSDIKMDDSDLYSGYSYAVIQKRGNKVSTLAKNNLKTWANPEIVDEFQKREEEVVHPYLKLIEDSSDFTEKQFWKNISIYLDLAGRYYLGVARNCIQPKNPNLPMITTDPTKFIMLNPYEIRRVIDKNKNVAGYIERKKDGRYREWPLHQIIEFRELNPFDPDNKVWAMTDAAKGAVYTINQSGDYTRQSLHGNIDAPGIITTDVLLNDEDFANFKSRITQHQKGEPLFGNGAGAIKWDAMQIDLDKAALLDINEINRTELFAVSGTSKTSLGIEQSGTTRETARVQSEQFVSDTAQPRLEDIVDFLNLDYKKYYSREYKKTGYKIEVESAVGRDYDTETKATALKQQQFQLAMTLIQSGYTTQSAYQFAEGQIDFEDLELEKGLDKPTNPEEPEQPDENSPTKPQDDPQGGSGSGNDKSSVSEKEASESANNALEAELEPHSDLVENGGSGSGNFGHAGRPGEVGGSAPVGSMTATVDSPDDDYVALDDKDGGWEDKIKTHYKTYKFGDQSYKAVTAEFVPEPDVLLVEGEGRNPETNERVDLLGYLDNYPNDTDVARALHWMRLKSLDTLGDWESVKAHLSKMNVRAEDERRKSKNSVEGEKSLPLACNCEHDHKVEVLVNELQEDHGKVVKKAYDEFLEEIRSIEKETIDACARKISVNAFEESDLIGKKKKTSLVEKLKNALHKYWWVVFPLIANNSIADRNKEFGKNIDFVFNNDLQKGVDDNASRVAEGHMETILGDILEASNKAYTQVTEEAAAELIIKAYKVDPSKYSEYFDHEPTMADALSSIRKTDILEENRRLYEKANQMAFEGYDRRTIMKAIRDEYKDISTKRAELIARNETSRAFTRSQFEADRQFLNGIGKLKQAYKIWYSRRPATEQDKICAFCNHLIETSNENPIPFEEPFVAFGDSMEVVDNDGKLKIFTANYEDIEGGVLHPNCACAYKLVFKNAAGEFVKTLNELDLNGGPKSGNFGHSGRPGLVGGSSKYPEVTNVAKRLASEKPEGELTEEYLNKVNDERKELFKLYGEDKDSADRKLRKWKDGWYMWGQDGAEDDGKVFSDIDIALSQAIVKASNDNSTVYRVQVDSKSSGEMSPSKYSSWAKNLSEVYRWGEFLGGVNSSIDLFKMKVSANNTVISPDVMYSVIRDNLTKQGEYVLSNKSTIKATKSGMSWQEVRDEYDKLKNSVAVKNGGPGSGNHGHSGRPGEVGGSSRDSFLSSKAKDSTWAEFKSMMGENNFRDAVKETGMKTYDDLWQFWAKEKIANFNKNKAKQISWVDAENIVEKQMEDINADQWFINADSNYKPRIVNRILENDDLHNAGLNLAYYETRSLIKDETGKEPTFQEFLKNPITLYRGTRGQKKIDSDWFDSYTPIKDFALEHGKQLTEIKIKPQETLGMYKKMAEREYLVLTKIKQKNSVQFNGGKGSGNYGHSGRPGEVGGSGKGFSDVESKAIKGYTAQGGQLSSEYKYSKEDEKVLDDLANSSSETSPELWRKISVSEAEKTRTFEEWYGEDKEIEVNFDKFQSFTEDKVRAHTMGGSELETILYHIPKGEKIKGVNISKESVYPEEKEHLVGSKNRFIVKNMESDSSTGALIITLTQSEKEKNDVGSNNLGGNSFDNGDSSNISDGTSTKSLNKRMDSKGMLHNTDGKYVAKAGLTVKPNWKTQVIEELSGADSSEGETNE